MKLASIAVAAITALSHVATATDDKPRKDRKLPVLGEVQTNSIRGRPASPAHSETLETADRKQSSCDRTKNFDVQLSVTTDDFGQDTAIYLSRPHETEPKVIFSAPMQSLESNKAYELEEFCLPKKDKDNVDYCYNLDVFDEFGDGIQLQSPGGIYFYVDGVMSFYINSEKDESGRNFKFGDLYFGDGCKKTTK